MDKNSVTKILEDIVVSPRLKPASKSFVESLLEQSKKRELSDKQIEYVKKFQAECFPSQETLDGEKAWYDSFTDEMRKNLAIMGEYYRLHYSNSRLAEGTKDPNWIPPKELYEKSVNSSWAKRIIGNYQREARFAVGDTCVLRDTAKNRSSYRDKVGSQLMILDMNRLAKNDFNVFYEVIEISKMDDQKTFHVREDIVNAIKHKKS